MTTCMTSRSSLSAFVSGIATIATGRAQPASSAATSTAIQISNVRIFNGANSQLRPGNLLVADRKIKQISSGPIAAPPDGQIIDGGGRVLMPGLTDATGT